MAKEFREVFRPGVSTRRDPALRIRVGSTTLDPAEAPDGYHGLLRRARLAAELHNRDHPETPVAVEEERDYKAAEP